MRRQTRTRTATKVKNANNARKPPKVIERKISSLILKRRRRSSQYRVLKAIKKSGGIMSTIAERLGCHPNAIYAMIARPGWEKVRAALEAERDRVLDMAERVILRTMRRALIGKGDERLGSRNARWFLEQKGKSRGYGNRVEVSGGDTPLRVEVEDKTLAQLPLAMRLAILAEMERQTNDRPKKLIASTEIPTDNNDDGLDDDSSERTKDGR